MPNTDAGHYRPQEHAISHQNMRAARCDHGTTKAISMDSTLPPNTRPARAISRYVSTTRRWRSRRSSSAGADPSSAILRYRARYTVCGNKGATLQHPVECTPASGQGQAADLTICWSVRNWGYFPRGGRRRAHVLLTLSCPGARRAMPALGHLRSRRRPTL